MQYIKYALIYNIFKSKALGKITHFNSIIENSIYIKFKMDEIGFLKKL